MSSILYGTVRLGFGLLYPAYASFKAVKDRNVKEYVKWMTYWIVYSLLSLLEEITDIFLYWIPLYYELKICILFWLISPTTRGASLLYRGLVHPTLISREDEIDMFLANMAEQSYSLSLRYARIAAQKFTKTMIETAIKGGGGLVTTLKRSVSMNDLDASEEEFMQESPVYSRRELMTKSWHEDAGSSWAPATEGPRQSSLRGPRTGRQSGALRGTRQATSETRQSQSRLDRRGERDENVSSDTVMYSTLPRTSKRGRSQKYDSLQSGKTDKSRSQISYQGSLKAASSRSTSNLQSADGRRRPPKIKNISAKPTNEAVKENQFSMSYSEEEEKKSCNFM